MVVTEAPYCRHCPIAAKDVAASCWLSTLPALAQPLQQKLAHAVAALLATGYHCRPLLPPQTAVIASLPLPPLLLLSPPLIGH